mgnify:CR=1 FL=1
MADSTPPADEGTPALDPVCECGHPASEHHPDYWHNTDQRSESGNVVQCDCQLSEGGVFRAYLYAASPAGEPTPARPSREAVEAAIDAICSEAYREGLNRSPVITEDSKLARAALLAMFPTATGEVK